MQNNLVFKDNTSKYENFDNKTNTLEISNVNDMTYYLTFDSYVPNNMAIKVKNSNVTIIEDYKGDIENASFNIEVDNNSTLNRFSIVVFNSKRMVVKRVVNNNGLYNSMQIDLTNNSVNSTEDINLLTSDANAYVIDGIYAVEESSKKYQTNLNHFASSCISKAQIFAINNDKANVQIYTDAFIKQGATHTTTNQEGRIINLSDSCSGIVLPNLHIDENDVEASHSCSVGSVNKEHMYYLESRGLSENEAKNILIKGYFNPILKEITDENVRNKLNEIIDRRIG